MVSILVMLVDQDDKHQTRQATPLLETGDCHINRSFALPLGVHSYHRSYHKHWHVDGQVCGSESDRKSARARGEDCFVLHTPDIWDENILRSVSAIANMYPDSESAPCALLVRSLNLVDRVSGALIWMLTPCRFDIFVVGLLRVNTSGRRIFKTGFYR